MESTAGAFGYLSQRLQMRDCGLFGRPRSHDPLLAIWLDGFNPIGAAEWNDPVGLHEVDIATILSGAQRLLKVRPRWSCGVRDDDPPVIETVADDHRALQVDRPPMVATRCSRAAAGRSGRRYGDRSSEDRTGWSGRSAGAGTQVDDQIGGMVSQQLG